MASDQTQRNVRRVAELIAKADALLITAGAGMGVDSGLPDFRGKDGFWRAYPALGKRGISFEQMAQPSWFVEEPEMAWAFYGHRQQLYRETRPHEGFRMLLEWGRAMPAGYFVVTSNVDGQFQVADFLSARILEAHGNIHRHQCTTPCCSTIWYYDHGKRRSDLVPDLQIDVGEMRAAGRLPRCPECGGMARPNVMMFGDTAWVPDVTQVQQTRYADWLASVRGKRVVVLELGAGKAMPTIRRLSENLAAQGIASLVRINPDASEADESAIPIRMEALEALTRIDNELSESFRARIREAVAEPREMYQFDEVSGRSPSGRYRFVSRDLATLKYQRMSSDAWRIRLRDGTEVWVERIDVQRNYLHCRLSVDVPLANHIPTVIDEARGFVRHEFYGPEPVVVSPKFYDAASATPILPPLRFAAQIVSSEPVGDTCGSWMNLIWFAEIDDEKSIKAFVEEALAQVDWKGQAAGYEI